MQRTLLVTSSVMAILLSSCHLVAGEERFGFNPLDEISWSNRTEDSKYDYNDIVKSPLLYNAFDSNDTQHSFPQNTNTFARFLLWTRNNKQNNAYAVLRINDDKSMRNSHFDGNKPTVFLTHGWSARGTTGWIMNAKTEYLKFQDCNFIAIDWEKYAGKWYYTAAKITSKVARYAAQFLDFLYEKHGLKKSGVYLVGHSLGAHLVGMMASELKNRPVPRITGLDPAGPGFYKASSHRRLDKSDATFVDIIHTSSGCHYPFVGHGGSIGHVDFFPNGGRYQRGCYKPFCSHSRAHMYWTESINGKTPFKSVPCSSQKSFKKGKCRVCGKGCLHMGVHVAKNLQGNYFLKTNKKSPFARG